MARATPGGQLRLPLHPRFIGAGSILLMGGCATDLMYWHTAIWQWANFSAWMIAAGLVMALVATIILLFDVMIGRARGLRWAPFGLVAGAALLSLLNVFVHSRDAWTSVVPQGLGLSIIVTVLLVIASGFGWRVTGTPATAEGGRT